MLDAVIETVKAERDVYPGTPELIAECRDILERCLFDRDAALAVLRGEHELDDDPWSRCPACECDTYFRLRLQIESRLEDGSIAVGPMMMFVCEACQYTRMRPRATVDDGLWWEQGERVRALPPEVGHPYRGDVEAAAEDEAEADDEGEAEDEAEDEEAAEPEDQVVEWSDRRMCPDGACIGIIKDGRCSVCGRSEDQATT